MGDDRGRGRVIMSVLWVTTKEGACDNVRPVTDDRGRGRVIMSVL